MRLTDWAILAAIVAIMLLILCGCSPERKNPLQQAWEWKIPLGEGRIDYLPDREKGLVRAPK